MANKAIYHPGAVVEMEEGDRIAMTVDDEGPEAKLIKIYYDGLEATLVVETVEKKSDEQGDQEEHKGLQRRWGRTFRFSNVADALLTLGELFESGTWEPEEGPIVFRIRRR